MIEWTPGNKHPATDLVVFKNVWGFDVVRRVLKNRCTICGYVLSEDRGNVREAIFKCGREGCHCMKQMGSHIHDVCDACYWMVRSIYTNPTLKNMNYFKEIDEKEEATRKEQRRRMGLEE